MAATPPFNFIYDCFGGLPDSLWINLLLYRVGRAVFEASHLLLNGKLVGIGEGVSKGVFWFFCL